MVTSVALWSVHECALWPVCARDAMTYKNVNALHHTFSKRDLLLQLLFLKKKRSLETSYEKPTMLKEELRICSFC